MRDFAFDPERAARSQKEAVELGVELQQLQTALIRWCGTQFGEAFVAWMHVKVRGPDHYYFHYYYYYFCLYYLYY